MVTFYNAKLTPNARPTLSFGTRCVMSAAFVNVYKFVRQIPKKIIGTTVIQHRSQSGVDMKITCARMSNMQHPVMRYSLYPILSMKNPYIGASIMTMLYGSSSNYPASS